MNKLIAGMLTVLVVSSCGEKSDSKPTGPQLIETSGRYSGSNVAGNLMATALKEVLQLDFAFYPSEFLSADRYALIEPGMTSAQITESVLPLYPEDGVMDLFQVGTLRGSDIKKFILNRTSKNYRADLQVAGLEYDIQYLGGLPTIYQIERAHGLPIDDSAYYRVAISDYQYYSGATFPGYRYGNGFDHAFRPESGLVSAREILSSFLAGFSRLPLLDEPRAQVRMRTCGGDPVAVSIPQIQGNTHLSPYLGKRVVTSGIITAVAQLENIEGMEIYLQDAVGDNDPSTSDAINIHLDTVVDDLHVNQKVEFTGSVYEIITFQGMTRTALREITDFKILSDSEDLPTAVVIGKDLENNKEGILPPDRYISRYLGNVNQKSVLNPEEGMDFWERLEGMRIKVLTPTVVDFRGGLAKYQDEESYLTVYVRPEGASTEDSKSDQGGLISDDSLEDYNPEIIRIVDSELAPSVTAAARAGVFEVGAKFEYDLEGVFSFQTNTFGDGEFVLFVTNRFSSPVKAYKGSLLVKDLADRDLGTADKPNAKFVKAEDRLTVGAFNVENLGGNLDLRIQRVAEAISVVMACPDITVLPEIQDFNGVEPTGGSAGHPTLEKLISYLNCPGSAYKPLNVDPVPEQDGGQPGGNIRVGMIYDSARVGFEARGEAKALDETVVARNGELNFNPGRIYPNDAAFYRSRKPLVAEFTFRGQKVYVIGTHLNSKLGDGNLWSAEQPMERGSEVQRNLVATRINQFIESITLANPAANVIVAGDMNAHHYEDSMAILAGDKLQNLMTYSDLVDRNRWYTSVYNGNSAAIDHIFASKNLLKHDPKMKIFHINSNYMQRVSDHDPIVSQFHFP